MPRYRAMKTSIVSPDEGERSLGDLYEVANQLRRLGPRCLVGPFERDVDVPPRRQEQRRVGERVADGHRIDIGRQSIPGVVGRDGQRLVRRPGLEWDGGDLVPGDLVDA